MITGLKSVKSDIAVILACDYLDIDTSVVLECISKLNSRSMVFPFHEGKEQYLFSTIRTKNVELLESQFMNGVDQCMKLQLFWIANPISLHIQRNFEALIRHHN